MEIISLVNHKGGVGKSASTQNLGKALTLLGKKVLLIDNDPQANLTVACGVTQFKESIYSTLCLDLGKLSFIELEKNLSLVPSELEYTKAEYLLQADIKGYFKLKKAISTLQEDFDFILIDCPPSLGVLTMNALIASNGVMVIVQSSYLSAKGLQTLVDIVEDLKNDLNPSLQLHGFLLTQTNNTVVRKDMASTIKETYANKVYKTVIRQNVAIEEASALGKDIFSYQPKSAGAEDYMRLAREILHVD